MDIIKATFGIFWATLLLQHLVTLVLITLGGIRRSRLFRLI